MNARLIASSAVALVVSTITGLAVAADLPKEGNYEITVCYTSTFEEIKFTPNYSVIAFEQIGIALSTPPGGLLDKASIRCFGLRTIVEGKTTVTNYCQAIVPDGSKLFSRFTGPPDAAVREVLAGTGAFEGLQMTGTVTQIGPFTSAKPGTNQACNRQVGVYRLK